MNWGILGCASIAKNEVIPAIKSVQGSKLIAVASRDLKKAMEFAQIFDCTAIDSYETLLKRDDIDAVYIPLPTGMHFEWAVKALENNKHVLVEKSATTSLEEAEKLIQLAQRKNLAIIENFQFQHHSQHQSVAELISNGEIGEIRCFRSSFGFPPFATENNIRYSKHLGGGALLDAGAYVLKASSFMLGDGFEVASAYLSPHKEYNVDWFGGAFLVNKTKGYFSEVAFGFDNFYQCNYEIWGSRGKITSTRAFTAKANFSPSIILEKHGYLEEIKLPTDNAFQNMISYFESIVKTNSFSKEWKAVLTQAKLIEQVRNRASFYE